MLSLLARVPWVPDHLSLYPIIRALHWVGHSSMLGLGFNGSHRLSSAGLWLGSSAWVKWWWLPSSWGSSGGFMVDGAGVHKALIHSSVKSSPRKLASSVGSDGASPKSSVKPNQTCFCTSPKGGHSATGLGGEQGHPVVCIEGLPIHILILDSHCQGEDEVHLRSSSIAHLWGVGVEGLGMVRCTCQNMPLVARNFDATGTHCSGESSCA